MSAIGSYAVVSRKGFQLAIDRAREVGTAEFAAAWGDALVQEQDFGYSGYVLGNYIDAQEMINGVKLVDEGSEVSTLLAKVFTAGFAFEERVSLPELTQEKLLDYGREEYGEEDAPGFAEAVTAAHSFYQHGLAEITTDNMVVFLIK